MGKLSENKKIYFASDIHLGMYPYDKSKKREKLFVEWLEDIRHDAEEIYLLGDVFDYWYEYKRVVSKGHVRFLGKIAEITDSGIPVHFFTGNHDIWTYGYLHDELGMEIHRKQIEKTFNDKKFYLAHGDGLGPYDKGYKIMKWIFTRKFLQWFYTRLHPNFSYYLGQTWAKKRSKAKMNNEEKFEGEKKEILIPYSKSLLEKTHYDYFIYGHRHLPMVIELNEKSTLINLGDWIKHFTYAVFDGEKTTLKSFVHKDKDYRIDV